MPNPQDTIGNTAKQNPALLLGLGGTGKQVLLNLRRMFYERYGSVTLPHVADLWIDTDTRNITLDGKPMDFLMQEVDFQEKERLSIPLQPSDLQQYYGNPDAYPHIHSWFDRSLRKHGHIQDGAGGIRSFGRLAFFRHYDKIRTRLLDRRTELERADVHNQSQNELGVALDASTMDIWAIFSVAGGTGSGIFLDLAFALRELWPNARVRAIILLPSVFSNNLKDRVYGNAYAALMELEHYTYSKDVTGRGEKVSGLHHYPLAWTREMYQRKSTLAGPVFDSVYLLGNRPASTKGALSLADKDALCRMIAETLYVEYSPGAEVTGLAAERRSARVNYSASLHTDKVHPYEHDGLAFTGSFARSYSSFGLSKIYIPIHRVSTALHHRLAQDLVDFWTTDKPIPTNLAVQLPSYLQKVGADNSSSKRDFLRALDTNNNNDRLVNQLQRILWGPERERILGMVNSPGVRNTINGWVDQELMGTCLDCNAAQRDRRGTLSKIVEQNEDIHFKKVCLALDGLVSEMLAEPQYRFEVAREILRNIRDRLAKDKVSFEKMAASMRNASAGFMRDAQARLQWLDDVQGSYSRRVIIEVALEDVEARVNNELKAQVASAAARLADRVADYIGRGRQEANAQGEQVTMESGLIKQLADFQQQLRVELGNAIRTRLEALVRSRPSPIYQDLGEGEQEVGRFYVDAKGDPVVQSTLATWEVRFFEEQPSDGPATLWQLRETLERNGVDFVLDQLLAFSRKTMHRTEARAISVIDRLSERYKPGSQGYVSVIENLLGYAQPWLAEPNTNHGDDPSKTHLDLWIALPSTASGGNQQACKKTLDQYAKTKYSAVATTPDVIYAYAELAAVPLMIIPELDRYRKEGYLPLLEQGEVLHTDLAFEKFQHLLIMQPDEVTQYVAALRVFLQAVALGIIITHQSTLKAVGEAIHFQFLTKDGLFEKTIDLGAHTIAVRRLAQPADESLRNTIHAAILNTIENMDSYAMSRWYALLSFHAQAKESYFAQFPQEVRAVFYQEAEKVRQGNPHAYEEAEHELKNLRAWAEERPQGSGLYYLRRAVPR